MVLLPLSEHLARIALRARGISSRWLPTPVGRVHAYVGPGEGSLPPVAVVHGIGSAGAPFAPVLARLQPHVRGLVAPELPGHGFSDPPAGRFDVEQLFDVMTDVLDRLIDEPVVLCGNSLGGGVALRYARERPEKVRALCLLSPAGARMNDEELADIRRAFHMPTNAEARAFLARVYHREPRLAPFIAGGLRERMSRAVVRDLLGSAEPEHAARPDELGALAMPVLLVWGRSERLLPASSLGYFREHLPPHARIEEPEALGHCPHFESPGFVARRILELAREARSSELREGAAASP